MKNLIIGSLVVASLLFTGCNDDDDDNNTTQQPQPAVFSVDAGSDVSVAKGEAVVIDATVTKAEGYEGNLTYEWKEGNTSLANVEDINYSADTEGVHTLTISVTDDNNNTVSDSVDVNVTTGDATGGGAAAGGAAGSAVSEYSAVTEAAKGEEPTCPAGFTLPTFAQIEANIDAMKALNGVNAESSFAAQPDADGKNAYYIPNGNHWKRDTATQKIQVVCVK